MTTKPRIRRMWQETGYSSTNAPLTVYPTSHWAGMPSSFPVLVIPLDPATLKAMEERAAKAIMKAWQDGDGYVNSFDEARAALAAVSPHLGRKA
jgi:hypothetical protein